MNFRIVKLAGGLYRGEVLRGVVVVAATGSDLATQDIATAALLGYALAQGVVVKVADIKVV